MGDNNIRVVVRFRPQNKRELSENGTHIVSFDDDMTSVKCESKDYPGVFNFDKIFDWSTSQDQVFSYSAGSIVNDIMNGYNGTIFAYGQTGSGKTHTMMGDMESAEFKGLTPRIVEHIFTTILNSPSNLEFTVKVSFMEIYMERIRDLLNPTNDNLPVHEDKGRGVYVKGLLEVFVGSIDEVYDAMRRGQGSRVVSSTNMNAESSRSHSIFVLQITQKNLNDGSIKTGKLSLVDLAGSEKVGKTGATGQTLEEAKKINKSLSALGMVINSLTDGKSSHIPYRDSKLTRILQESLGGNSRTTLIINCSPSSFNEAETVSTLRFGMRAKTIKNKAKINAELSPNELKTLLKRAKIETAELESQIVVIETELIQWRAGQTVPESDWAQLSGKALGVSQAASPVAPALLDLASSRSSAPSTPTGPPLAISDDDREEFLRRENELADQLADKEKDLKRKLALVDELQEELNFIKAREVEIVQENKVLGSNMTEMQLQLEKVLFENKESLITVDTLKESKVDLERNLELLKKQILELQATKMPEYKDDDEKEKKKQEKMAQMMAEFDPTTVMDDKEKQMRDTLIRLTHMKETSKPPTEVDDISAQHFELLDVKTQLAHQQVTITDLTEGTASRDAQIGVLRARKEEVEAKLSALESEYEQLLEKTIQEEEQHFGGEISNVVQDLKAKLEVQYGAKRDLQDKEIEDLQAATVKKDEEISRLQRMISEKTQETQNMSLSVGSPVVGTPTTNENGIASLPILGVNTSEEIEKMRKTMAQQLIEFDAMKKKLMRDLQNRCEKVVELEISLDETREQYNNILRNSNSRAQQQKMAVLEHNLEQLKTVQKGICQANETLKKDLAVADRKLSTRNERIQNLETLLQDSQAKIEMQNQKYEAQISTMREKLRQSQAQQDEWGSTWVQSSRIAKPLRGGGAAHVAGEDADDTDSVDTLASTPNPKRSSWYVSLLKK
ncbi:hypothetical protein BASA50_010468 [Batrachochytrium salamandrivorans]|uniref:Kinesin-like protein n=1 Tax=Batrachochytrium salamandrivorans TaxID=1357716 RepID=A0ABQ8EYG4_9FUNG|nr:hypothetical protein BASA62_009158 [Batrachochytrium salamandrivorans]KAH6564659.1 hypothetical protein BASA60_010210 [Batrachochytrium salamandrivorans]KAH6588825.1 hypothetical protein BASA50_010468 [Batrachochytrium salamandrivorans]KAH9248831.1 hypothetical protein BASA81_013488 [Batrachochytrium salamandrivorans]KAH9264944.1 hypothetical protein BASA83_011535 [Batrachochytrium salamandrivorans]